MGRLVAVCGFAALSCAVGWAAEDSRS